MALQVGINNSVVIKAVAINDQYNSLDITIARSAAPVVAEAIDEFSAFLDGSSTTASPASLYPEEQRISRYPFSTEGYANAALESSTIANNIALQMAEFRHILVQGKLAVQYNQVAQKDRKQFLKDMIKFPKTIAVYKELGIVNATTLTEKLQDQAILDAISKALFSEFIEKFEEEEVGAAPLRALLVRTSKNKHYPTMRRAKFEDGPINQPTFEREDLIPVEKSKLAFTKWEKENGFDNGDKLQADSPTSSADVNELFGQPAVQELRFS